MQDKDTGHVVPLLSTQEEEEFNLGQSSSQLRALFRKSATLKKRQPLSVFCNLCCPCTLICIVGLAGVIVSTLTSSFTTGIQRPDPVVLNQGNDGVAGYDCYEWLYFSNAIDGDAAGTLDSNGTKSGMLGTIPQTNCQTNKGPIFTPFFEGLATPKDIDDALYNAEVRLRNLSLSEIHDNPSVLNILADGAVLFNNLSVSDLSIGYTIQWPDTSDVNYNYLTTLLRQTDLQGHWVASITNLMDSAFLNAVTAGVIKSIETSIQEFPSEVNIDSLKDELTNTIGSLAYPFALSLLLPSLIHAIVLEKQEKLREFMKMMGMVMPKYWAVTFLFDFLVYGIICLFVLILGLIWQLSFFLYPPVLIMLMITWGFTTIGMAFLVSTWMSRNRTITAFALYLVVIVGVCVGFGLNVYYGAKSEMPFYLMLYPPFAFYRGMYLLAMACAASKCIKFTDVTPGSEIASVFVYLWLENLILYLLAFWMDSVLPSTFGIRKHPLFFILEPLAWLKRKRNINSINERQEMVLDIENLEVTGIEDEDVQEERKLVESGKANGKPVVIYDLFKQFDGKQGKVAVDRLFLSINENETFGLLGPNGAGKTTTISMLTGLFPPTSGTAQVCGYSIVKQIDQVHLTIGICPQFDIHWPSMTVEEHLLFYARLKGVPVNREKDHVISMATRVGLQGDMQKKSSELSGGMRRRLSVAIAFIGNPKVVFLDEPSSGLDPTSRRHLWEVIDHYKQGRSIILTTHSMEEADTLCTRIGIIAKGRLQCLGSPIHLKTKFGKGYSLYINFKQDGIDKGSEFVDKLLGGKYEIVNAVGTYRIYRTSKGSVKLSNLLRSMESNKEKNGIEDWGLSQTSLEEVFLSICREQEADEVPLKSD